MLDMWDTQSSVITAGSGRKSERSDAKKKIRKGAQMVTMSIWHPDVEEFITAKQTPGRLTKFNMSVLITDEFMEAVEKHSAWTLEFPDYEKAKEEYSKTWNGDLKKWKTSGLPTIVYKIFEDANVLWETINQSTYNRNEPGVLFVDTINKMNNLHYCEHITATNPCVSGDTLVLTSDGYLPVHQLIGKQFKAVVKGEEFLSTDQGFWCSGEKELFEVALDNGMSVKATANHKLLEDGVKVMISELKVGDELDLMPDSTTSPLQKSPIKSITPIGVQPVFDCTIPGPHVYSANGITSSNCGEQILPIGGVCLLGSLNLTQFVNASTSDWDFDKLAKVIPVAVRFMDNVNDRTYVPLEEQYYNLRNKRRIGLGVMGYASSLYMMKIPYSSPKALAMTEKLMEFIMNEAYMASVNLAIEKGPFPLFEAEKYLASGHTQLLSQNVRQMILKHGIRNSHLMSIQPTGNSSVVAGVSGGLEPVFMKSYIRTSMQPFPPQGLELPTQINFERRTCKQPARPWDWIQEGDENLLATVFNNTRYKIDRSRGLLKETLIEDYGIRWLKYFHHWDGQGNPEYLKSTLDLTVEEHLSTMTIFAKYVCSAVSKTCNIPKDYPYEDFKQFYIKAHKTGYIKGVTTYRAGTMVSVLAAAPSEQKQESVKAAVRPEVLECDVEIFQREGDTWIVIVGLLEKRPYEVFCFKAKDIYITGKLKKGQMRKVTSGDTSQYNFETDYFVVNDIAKYFERPEEEAMTRMISTALKHGADISYIYTQLMKARGTIVSFSKAIARSLAKYVKLDEKELTCPNCQSKNSMIFQEGCLSCSQCEYSKCG
jgi:ribonucleotide reductase alpha subunit